jgi:hypothetical protein
VHAGRDYPLLLELAVEKHEGITHDSRAAPLRVVTDAPMVPSHQVCVAGVVAAMTTAQDVIDAVKPEAALIEQALPLDGVKWLPGRIGHGPHSLGRRNSLSRRTRASPQAADRGEALLRRVTPEVLLDAKDSLAFVVTHIPDPRRHFVHSYGVYFSVARAWTRPSEGGPRGHR